MTVRVETMNSNFLSDFFDKSIYIDFLFSWIEVPLYLQIRIFADFKRVVY